MMIQSYVPIVISIVGLLISIITLWDSSFRYKLRVQLGHQVIMCAYKGKPVVLLIVNYMNLGGKPSEIQDAMIKFVIINNSYTFEMKTQMECININSEDVDFRELTPTPILGKSSTMKKIMFIANNNIDKKKILDEFEFRLDLFVIEKNRQKKYCSYYGKTSSIIWQDMDSEKPSSCSVDIRRRANTVRTINNRHLTSGQPDGAVVS